MNAPSKVLLLIVNEADVWNDTPLYTAIVQRLRQLGLSGATVSAGIMGFGRHHRLHHKGLFGISDDRPITIVVVDDEGKVRAAAHEIRAMVRDGLILLLDAEQVPERPNE